MVHGLGHNDLAEIVTLTEEAHKATNCQDFRMIVIQGVGSLIDSLSCVWTEIGADCLEVAPANTSVAEISNKSIEADDVLEQFNALTWQHPVIVDLIKNQTVTAIAISDLVTQHQFRQLELYQRFYQPLGIEDQMTVGFVYAGKVRGLSLNRASWGFSADEQRFVSKVAACTFPFYRSLLKHSELEASSEQVMAMNYVDLTAFASLLGITQRQAELLGLVATGKSNKQIADRLSISEGTVRKHMENCFRRLEVNNRVGAVTKAMKIIRSAT